MSTGGSRSKAVVCAVICGGDRNRLQRSRSLFLSVDLAAVLSLLGTYGVLALVVERTPRPHWRVAGATTAAPAPSNQASPEAAPHSFSLQQAAAETDRALAEEVAARQRIALRAGVVLGLPDCSDRYPYARLVRRRVTLRRCCSTPYSTRQDGGHGRRRKRRQAVDECCDGILGRHAKRGATIGGARDAAAPLSPNSIEIPPLTPWTSGDIGHALSRRNDAVAAGVSCTTPGNLGIIECRRSTGT